MIQAARQFAIAVHGDQKRKYTNEPYWHHCERVAMEVMSRGGSEEMIAAAYLHDTIEDTDATYEGLKSAFGLQVAGLVDELTDRYTKELYPSRNRAWRKTQECERWSRASWEAKLIKLCDLIDNTETIVRHDPKFAVVYLREKADLLEALGY